MIQTKKYIAEILLIIVVIFAAYLQMWIMFTIVNSEVSRDNTKCKLSIKFYTYKQLLYILIQFNIITYNQKNELLTTYLDKL